MLCFAGNGAGVSYQYIKYLLNNNNPNIDEIWGHPDLQFTYSDLIME